MLYDLKMVMNYLPHRDPFLFIDSVESVSIKKGVDGKNSNLGGLSVSHYHTRDDHPIFKGHFPGNPILPGVVQVEMMAQASSFTITRLIEIPLEKLDIQVALMGVDDAKFRKPILPEMDLVIHAECIKDRGAIMVHECKIFHNDQLMSQAKILASIKWELRS